MAKSASATHHIPWGALGPWLALLGACIFFATQSDRFLARGHGSGLLNAAVDQLRQAGADTVTAWLLADDEETRAFLAGSGLGPDGAFRDRVVSPDGDTLREVRVLARLDEPDGG